MRRATLLAAMTATFCGAQVASAATVAYYRFEAGPDGGFLSADGGGPTSSLAFDEQGNNHLRTFNAPANPNFNFDTSPRYRAEVPTGSVPQTGATNNFSFRFDGSDDIYLDSPATAPLTTNFDSGTTFTIEAYVRTFADNQFRTFVGRDNAVSFAEPTGLFYLQQRGGGINKYAISARQKSGTFVEIESTGPVALGQWVHLAAVSDGSTLSLFVDGTHQGSLPYTGLYDAAANEMWTIGRGWFNGPNDFADANIDEVRFSDVALAPSQFLNATPVPEPTSLVAGSIILAGALLRRRG